VEWSFCSLWVPTPNPARFRQTRASYVEAQQVYLDESQIAVYWNWAQTKDSNTLNNQTVRAIRA